MPILPTLASVRALSALNRFSRVAAATPITLPQRQTRGLAARRPNFYQELPVLSQLAARPENAGSTYDMSNTAVLFVGHALQTTYNVVEAMVKHGLSPEATVMTGKRYSQNEEVVEAIEAMGVHYIDTPLNGPGRFSYIFDKNIHMAWHYLENNLGPSIEQILILDHSGKGVQYAPRHLGLPMVGVAKTTADIFLHRKKGTPFPVIDMARSDVKKRLESPLIAKAVIDKTTSLVDELLLELNKGKQPICGVLGAGSIGSAVCRHLARLGYQVIVYDNDSQLTSQLDEQNPNITAQVSSCLVYSLADVIFGCTGTDMTVLDSLSGQLAPKILVSCSSDDTEFNTILGKTDQIEETHSGTIIYSPSTGIEHAILKGGFPANFDNSGESVPARDIDVTRSLTLASVYQGLEMLEDIRHGYNIAPNLWMLDPELQQYVAERWLAEKSTCLSDNQRKANLKTIADTKEHSGGELWESARFFSTQSKPRLHASNDSIPRPVFAPPQEQTMPM